MSLAGKVVVVTGDRDSYQLVADPHIRVLYNKRGVSDYALNDEAGFLERTGVTPAQYPEYAALRGDRLRFVIVDDSEEIDSNFYFDGRVSGDAIEGTVLRGVGAAQQKINWRATRLPAGVTQ